MAEKILIAQEESEGRNRLCAALKPEGYELFEAEGLESATRLLRKFPALLLLDVQLAAREGPGAWNAFGQLCQGGSVPCLAFSTRGQPPAKIGELAPWAADTILHPDDNREVLHKVASQFTIHRLTYEFKLAHHLLFQKQLELERCLRSASHIQECLVPSRFPRIGNLDFAWRFMPCKKIGGDLFNVLQLDEETVMAYVLDVSGHDISSAMVTVSVYQTLSRHLGQSLRQRLDAPPFCRVLSPAEVLRKLDEEYPFERFDTFFTISYLLVNPATGRLRYSSAGHPPPVVIRADGTCEVLRQGGTVIGMAGAVPFEEGETVLGRGDRLYLYTDGITEHGNDVDELYGEERFVRQLAQLQTRPLGEVCERVVESLQAFGRGRTLEDDVTLLGIECVAG